MKVAGFGRGSFWEGGSVWIAFITGVSELHWHHAIQVSLPFDGDVQFKTSATGDWVHYPGALIAPDREQVFQAPGHVVANLFFEPESRAGKLALERLAGQTLVPLDVDEVRRLGEPLAAAYASEAPDTELAAVCRRIVVELTGADPRQGAQDVRVQRAMRTIRERLDQPLTLAEVGRACGLSAGRLRHLFVQETGVSFRAFLLWERLNRAMSLAMQGVSLTEAAHAANFSDSAHLTRTCRRMFGFAPSAARLSSTAGASSRLRA